MSGNTVHDLPRREFVSLKGSTNSQDVDRKTESIRVVINARWSPLLSYSTIGCRINDEKVTGRFLGDRVFSIADIVP